MERDENYLEGSPLKKNFDLPPNPNGISEELQPWEIGHKVDPKTGLDLDGDNPFDYVDSFVDGGLRDATPEELAKHREILA